jgi:hypothetical protein
VSTEPTIREAVQAIGDPSSALGAFLREQWAEEQRCILEMLRGSFLLYPAWMHTKRGRRQLRRRARRARKGKA